jgi:hypothetical protein
MPTLLPLIPELTFPAAVLTTAVAGAAARYDTAPRQGNIGA